MQILEKNQRQLRIRGNEPTICRKHLIRMIELAHGDYVFIRETGDINWFSYGIRLFFVLPVCIVTKDIKRKDERRGQ